MPEKADRAPSARAPSPASASTRIHGQSSRGSADQGDAILLRPIDRGSANRPSNPDRRESDVAPAQRPWSREVRASHFRPRSAAGATRPLSTCDSALGVYLNLCQHPSNSSGGTMTFGRLAIIFASTASVAVLAQAPKQPDWNQTPGRDDAALPGGAAHRHAQPSRQRARRRRVRQRRARQGRDSRRRSSDRIPTVPTWWRG